MFYKVISLENTRKAEKNFDAEYNKKYIGKIGERQPHNLQTEDMINHYFLVFEKENGRIADANWIHKDDLEIN